MDSAAAVRVPLERAGTPLFLSRLGPARPRGDVLLVHGITYSSHQFDVRAGGCSLALALARAGWSAWMLDIAGYGRSGAVADGFSVTSETASLDIEAAAGKILSLSAQPSLNLLGWSWGAVTASRFAARRPSWVRRLVLHAPILHGLGPKPVTEPFETTSWTHAAADFQKAPDGSVDAALVDPATLAEYMSGCWRWDGHGSPNGGRIDLMASPSRRLIDFAALASPALVIAGTRDPYVDLDGLRAQAGRLPPGSQVTLVPGASHAMIFEKGFSRILQDACVQFLA